MINPPWSDFALLCSARPSEILSQKSKKSGSGAGLNRGLVAA